MSLQLCFLKIISGQPHEAEFLTISRKVTGHFYHFSSSRSKPQADEGLWNCLVVCLYKMLKSDGKAATTLLRGSLNARRPLTQRFADWNTNRAGLPGRPGCLQSEAHVPAPATQLPRAALLESKDFLSARCSCHPWPGQMLDLVRTDENPGDCVTSEASSVGLQPHF